jgi:hypothetical protein
MLRNKSRGAQGYLSVFLLVLGIVITAISFPSAMQTIEWMNSPNWNQPGNAMPLLMIFIIPIAIVSWSGLIIGLSALGVGIALAISVLKRR